MDNLINNSISNTKPIKYIGLSRKRKNKSICSGHPKHTIEDCCERKIVKENTEVTNKLELSGATMNDRMEEENILKNARVMKDRIEEIEYLYSIWRNACKSAFLYLSDMVKKMQDQNVNGVKLLRELELLDVILTHFKNDSDFGFSSSD